MGKLKLYQCFHDKYNFELCSKSPEIIKIYTGCESGKHTGINGDFIIANEGKYPLDGLCDFNAFQYMYNHISEEEYIGLITSTYNTKVRTSFRPAERILEIDLDKIFEEYHIISFYGWNMFPDTYDHCPGMIEFMLKWLKEDLELTNIQEIKKMGEELSEKRLLPKMNCLILPVNEFKDFFQFFARFMEYVNRNYNINKYELDIWVPYREKGWAYYGERMSCFWLLVRYGKELKNKIF